MEKNDALGKPLLRWYRKHGRKLPWRKTRNTYHIVVSEIMLQQTQVERVKIYYKVWLKQFPTWVALSKATNAQVIHAWAGLGYNRRALMLRDIARSVVKNGVPQTREHWQNIKGIGPYTSAAVSAFAQKKRVLPIDTNIRRVLGRILLKKPFATIKDDEQILSKIDLVLPKRGFYYDVPQAIFDLATMICTKKPECSSCPLKTSCPLADRFIAGEIPIPKRSIKKATERHHRNKKYPDRIYRGRILEQVRKKTKINVDSLGSLIDPSFDVTKDQTWIENMIDRLVKDQLLVKISNTITLP